MENQEIEQQEEKKHSRLSTILVFIIIVAIVGGLIYWVENKKPTGQQRGGQAVLVSVATVGHKDIPVYLNGLGTIQAYNTATVRSQIDGQLLQVLFHEGQDVKKGDVLAKIDPRTYEAQLNQAIANKAKDEASLANAQVDLKRYESLGDDISAQTVDTQRATVKQLQATVAVDQAAIDNDKALLSYTVINAPFDGRTGIRQVDVGNVIHAGDTNGLVVITQLDPISVVFSLPQQNIEDINQQIANQGKLEVIAVDSSKKELSKGELVLVDNQIDQNTGTVKLKATFPNQQHLLWPGAFVNVRMLLNTIKDAVVVPTVAIQLGPNGSYVFIAKQDNKVEMRPVKTGIAEGNDTVITSGVKEGEVVVTDGMQKLQDGSKITLPGQQPQGKDGAATSGKAADYSGKRGEGEHHHRHNQNASGNSNGQ